MAGIKAELLLNFKQEGLDKVYEYVKSITQEFENLKQITNSLKLPSSFKTSIKNLNNEFTILNNKILKTKKELELLSIPQFNQITLDTASIKDFNKTVQKLNTLLNTINTKLKNISNIKLNDDSIKNLIKDIQKLNKILNTTNIKIKNLPQISNINIDTKLLKETLNNIKNINNILSKTNEKFDKAFNVDLSVTDKTLKQFVNSIIKLNSLLNTTHKKIKSIENLKLMKLNNDIVNITNDTKKITTSFNALQQALLQNKDVLKSYNQLLINQIKQQSKLLTALKNQINLLKETKNLVEQIDKIQQKNIKTIKTLEKANKSANSYKDIKKVSNEVKTLSHFYDRLEKIVKDTNDRFKILETLNFPTKELEKMKKTFNKLIIEAEENKDLFHLREQAAEIRKITNIFGTLDRSVRGTVEQVTMLHNKIKDMTAVTAQDFGKEVRNIKSINNQLDNMIKKYNYVNLRLKEHINVRKQWASSKDIQKAAQLVDAYNKKLKELSILRTKLIKQQNILKNTTDEDKIKKAVDNIKNITKSMFKLKNELNHLDIKLAKIKSNLNDTTFFKWIKNVTKTTVAYGSLYLGLYEVFNVIRNSISYIIEYDKSLKSLQAVLGIAGYKAKYLQDRLVKLGISYGGTLKDINETAIALARAGIETTKLAKATEVVIKMAKLTGDTFQISADAIVTFMTVYKDAKVSIKELGDELAYVANASKLSTEDIATFSNYALQTAKAAGITRHMIEAMAIAFSNAGTRAETIGTAIRRFATLATDNAKPVQDFFTRLGMSQQTFAYLLSRSAEDANRTMIWLLNRLKNMSDREFQVATSNMEILAKQSLTLYRQNADEILKHFQTLQAGVNGELEKANIITDSYLGTWEKLKNAFGEAFLKLNENLFPLLQKLGYSLINTINTISNNMPIIINYFDNLIDKLKILAGIIGSIYLFKNIGKIKDVFDGVVSGIGAASLAALNFKKILGTIKKIIFAIGSFFLRNPILAGISAIAYISYDLYTTVKKSNNELEKTNKLLQTQQQLNNIIIRHDELINKKLSLQQQLENAVLNGNIKQAEEIQKKIDLLKKEIAHTNKLKENVENRIEMLQQEKEIIRKYLQLQEKAKLLQEMKNEYEQTHNEKLLFKINILEEEVKQLQQYKKEVDSIIKKEKQLTFLKGLQLQAQLSQNMLDSTTTKPNTEETVLPEAFKNYSDKSIKPVDISNLLSKTGSKELNVMNNKLEQAKKTIELIYTLTDKELDTFGNLNSAIKDFYKQGLNVKDLMTSFNKEIEEKVKKSLKGTYKLLSEDYEKIFTKMELPDKIETQIQNIFKTLKTANNVKDIKRLNLELTKLKLNLVKIKDKDTKDAVSVFVKTLEDNLKKVNKAIKLKVYPENVSSIIKKLQNKLKDIDLTLKISFSTQKQLNKLKDEIDKKIKELGEKVYINFYFKTKGKMPLQDEIKKLKTEINSINNRYDYYVNLRNEKEKEFYDLVKKIKKLQTLSNVDNKLATSLIQKKKELEKEINSILVEEQKLIKKNIDLEIKIEEIKKKQLLALKEMKKEINKNLNVSMFLEEFQNKALNWRQKIGLIDFNKEEDTNKINAYFEWIESYLTSKSKNVQDKLKQTIQSIRTISGADTSYGGVSGAISAYEKYQKEIEQLNTLYDRKAEIIMANEQRLREMREAGKISELEFIKQMNELEIQMEEDKARRIQELNNARFSMNLAVVNSYLGELSSTFAQFRQAGYAKDRQWFNTYKAMMVAMTIINTYASAQKAMVQLPFPINYAAAATAIASGLMRLAIIKAQRYHTGGYVDRDDFNKRSMGGLRNDEIPTILQRGEYVLSRKDLEAISRVSSPNVNVTAEAPAPEIVIINDVSDEKYAEYLQSRQGREIIKNIVH